MKSLWDNTIAQKFIHQPLQLRVYSSRLIGQEPDLVLHGGGNTSVKTTARNIFGDTEELIYIKGSGWDLASIEIGGFPAVRLQVLKRMVQLDHVTDTDMVRVTRSAMVDPGAPTPSVEAILHAIVPFKYVDHTHADAVVTITNTPNGMERVREIYGDSMLIIPYVMPGFVLAKKVFAMTRDTDWSKLDGMILLSHGIFTFDNDARNSYERMIDSVTKAENYLEKKARVSLPIDLEPKEDLVQLAHIRRAVSLCKGSPVHAKIDQNSESVGFARLKEIHSVATRGPLTPDHVIRTKRTPLILSDELQKDIEQFVDAYKDYFNRYGNDSLKCLDPAPRWAIWPGYGVITFGSTVQETRVISEISRHTIHAIQLAESMGGWNALSEKDIFDVEYWELEQAKLKRGGSRPIHQGKIAMVTGAACGIGRACVEKLIDEGAVVAALDIRPEVSTLFSREEVLGLQCDVTDSKHIGKCIHTTVRYFGGLDILISNAGVFPRSESLMELGTANWNQSLEINLSSHQRLLSQCIPYLSHGIDPAAIFIASKNVAAPGRGAAAYSVAKAGLTQLARIAALELGTLGIRVNVIHPNAVFDTEIWTDNVLRERASRYGMTVDQYKINNLLNVEVTSEDVAKIASALAGTEFAKTTGAQIPVDGGNDRVV